MRSDDSSLQDVRRMAMTGLFDLYGYPKRSSRQSEGLSLLIVSGIGNKSRNSAETNAMI